MMNDEQRKKLLTLARWSLENQFFPNSRDLSSLQLAEFREKRGIFVTLEKNGDLRGCIGKIEAEETIYRGIIRLSCSAAFDDPRFPSLQQNELEEISLEISILGIPQKVRGKSMKEKMAKLRPFEDGVIVSKRGGLSATFLPQVWDSLPNPEDFISQLCKKAGLSGDIWKKEDLDMEVYLVEHFQEDT